MAAPLIASLPYREDAAAFFEPVADWPWSVLLDSGGPVGERSRYALLAARPFATLTCRGATSVIQSGSERIVSATDPLLLLRDLLGPRAPASELLFRGGAIGWFGYDLARRWERLPAIARDEERLPDLAIGLYDWAVLLDRRQRQAWLVGSGRDPDTRRNWNALLNTFSTPAPPGKRTPFGAGEGLRVDLAYPEYRAAFRRIQDYIRAGDCYQVNLARRFSASAHGDPWEGYRRLRAVSPAPFSAYFHTPYAHVLCASPERFLKIRGNHVETRPIKGTRPRHSDPLRDAELARELQASPKDRAENLMIVDLLRNDLSKTCAEVRVPELFRVESFPAVHHLVSTVTGSPRAGQDALDVLRGCFPGGSITGAPKRRAMEIIDELEPRRRGIYCGAIGYLGFDGSMDSNIAIRTVVVSGGMARYWVGGGIVADSKLDEEFQETLDKGAALARLLDFCPAPATENP